MKGVFEKGYTGQFTEEIFIVDKVKLSAVPQIVYKLRDWNAQPIEGSFYAKELQLVRKGLEEFWKVEEVLDRRTIRGKKRVLVKWEGHPHSLNSWVAAEDVIDI